MLTKNNVFTVQRMLDREMGSSYASKIILPWSPDQMKITLLATTVIHYG